MKNIKKFYIETFGCQMNEFDSERIIFLLKEMGYTQTDRIKTADLIVINTCSVREKAENRLYGHIGNLKSLKSQDPDLIICIGGCTAQNYKDKIQRDFPYVDIVFGTQNAGKLPFLLEKRLRSGHCICDTSGINYPNKFNSKSNENYKEKDNLMSVEDGDYYDCSFYNFSRKYSFKAYLPVMVGCNNFCSYCIVPYVRGRERSVNPHIILNKVKDLVLNEGVVEIMLLGQNVNSYGFDFYGRNDNSSGDYSNNMSFASLLNEIAYIKELKRIRFMTSHPKDFSEDLIAVIRDNKNIMNHVHLPLQAGSDRMLRLMNRKYSIKEYLKLYETIKNEIPDCAITTDIIVGFPGEEEEDFRGTLDIVRNLRFNRAFTFLYSLRKGTKAENFKDNTLYAEKKKWFKELVEIQNNISYEENSKLVGKKFEVLVEGKDIKNRGFLKGRLENNNTVNFSSESSLIGNFTDINITEAKSFYLTGEIDKIT